MCGYKARNETPTERAAIQNGSSCILLENLILSQNKAVGFRHTKVQLSWGIGAFLSWFSRHKTLCVFWIKYIFFLTTWLLTLKNKPNRTKLKGDENDEETFVCFFLFFFWCRMTHRYFSFQKDECIIGKELLVWEKVVHTSRHFMCVCLCSALEMSVWASAHCKR